MKFRKKPVVIEAFQLPPVEHDHQAFLDWAKSVDFNTRDHYSGDDLGIVVETLEGNMRATPGDWIIKGIKGEFYPCKPDIFEATYETVEGEDNAAA